MAISLDNIEQQLEKEEVSCEAWLVDSISDFTDKLGNKNDREPSELEYRELCHRLTLLTHYRSKNFVADSLSDDMFAAVKNLYEILQNTDYSMPSRSWAKFNHSYFYHHILMGLLSIITNELDNTKNHFLEAKQFPEKTKSFETDKLWKPIETYLELLDFISNKQEQTPYESGLTLNNRIAIYQDTNTVDQLINFSDEKLAKYFIDPCQQLESDDPIKLWNNGEPGSVNAMINMVKHLTTTSNDPITIDFIKSLNEMALEGVTLPQNGRIKKIIPGQFRSEPVGFGMLAGKYRSLEGYHAINTWAAQQNSIFGSNTIKFELIDSRACRLKLYSKPSQIEVQLTSLIEHYQQEIDESCGDKQKIIYACLRFAHQLCLIHPFSDGNLRVAQQLLNRLFLDNDLPLCILPEPSLLEELTLEQMMPHILKGFYYFHALNTQDCLPCNESECSVFEGDIKTLKIIADKADTLADKVNVMENALHLYKKNGCLAPSNGTFLGIKSAHPAMRLAKLLQKIDSTPKLEDKFDLYRQCIDEVEQLLLSDNSEVLHDIADVLRTCMSSNLNNNNESSNLLKK